MPDGGPFATSIAWAAENSIVAGYTDGQFLPSQQISGLEASIALHGYARTIDGEQLRDAPRLREVVSWVERQQLLGQDVVLSEPLTRVETMRMLLAYAVGISGQPAPADTDVLYYGDVDERDATTVMWAVENRLFDGRTDGTMGPLEPLSRGEFVEVLHRFEVAFDGGEQLLPLSRVLQREVSRALAALALPPGAGGHDIDSATRVTTDSTGTQLSFVVRPADAVDDIEVDAILRTFDADGVEVQVFTRFGDHTARFTCDGRTWDVATGDEGVFAAGAVERTAAASARFTC